MAGARLITTTAFCLTLSFLLIFSSQLYALDPEQVKLFDLGIYNFDIETNECKATPVSNTAGSIANFNPDPVAVEQYETTLKPQIDALAPLYQRGAKEAGLASWQLLPALHNLEFGLRRTNPTSNPGFRGVFQQGAKGLRDNGIDPNASPYATGEVLTDDGFVKQAKDAANIYIRGKAQSFKIDISQPLSLENAAKIAGAYKSGQGSVWFTGKADFNLHAYVWAGFDTTPQHKLPMHYGPGSPYADEKTSVKISKPGAATLFALVSGTAFSGGGGGCSSAPGNAKLADGTRDELVNIILSSPNIKFGNYGNAKTQRSDIEKILTEHMVRVIATLVQNSGAKILVNALKTDHDPGSLHEQGRAIDIGYYGNGHSNHKAEGDTLYKFIYDNYQALKVRELIWQEPPAGYKCIGRNGPGDCNAIFGQRTMDAHDNHIHLGVQE